MSSGTAIQGTHPLDLLSQGAAEVCTFGNTTGDAMVRIYDSNNITRGYMMGVSNQNFVVTKITGTAKVGIATTVCGGGLSVSGNVGIGSTFASLTPPLDGMIISGSVGIGTSTPLYKLDVQGIVNATALYVNSAPYIGSQWTTSGNNINYVNGNVGIGTALPTQRLHVDGHAYVNGDITALSDQRFKKNFEVIPNAMQKVSQCAGYTFERTDEIPNTDGIVYPKRYAGVIAQEVEKVLPEVVYQDAQDKKSVAYGNMVAILIEALKEVNTKVDSLARRLETIEAMQDGRSLNDVSEL